MVTVVRCHQCQLVVSVDCTNCQHTLDIHGIYSQCVAREMGADEFELVPFAKGKKHCLSRCMMKGDYVDMWRNRQQLLQKPKPCPGCVVTLLRVCVHPVARLPSGPVQSPDVTDGEKGSHALWARAVACATDGQKVRFGYITRFLFAGALAKRSSGHLRVVTGMNYGCEEYALALRLW